MSEFKSSITIEASFIVSSIIYCCIFFVDAIMYYYDKNTLYNNLVVAGSIIQNYYECSDDENEYIINFKTENKAREYLTNTIDRGYTFSRLNYSDVKIKLSDIVLKAKINYIGISFLFRNVEIFEEVKFALMTPTLDLRINKEIKNFRKEK